MTETPNTRLTGPELLAMVASMPNASRSELVRAAGYVDPDGRRRFGEFYEAMLAAKGQKLPGASCAGDGRGNRSLSYRTTVLSHGGMLVGKRYVEAMGLEVGDQADIQVKNGKLILVKT
jgi:hypothetical protein